MMLIRSVDMHELTKSAELLSKNNRCTECSYINSSGCGTRLEKRCIKSKEYWVNYLSNLDEKEYIAITELVLSGKYIYK